MTDFMLPDDLVPREVRWGASDSTSAFASDTTGALRTSEIVGGSALTPALRWPPVRDDAADARRRGRLLASLNRLRGQANRLWVPIPGYVQQGSFSAPELLGNNTFADGTSGWTTSGPETVLSVVDRMMRIERRAGVQGRVMHNTTALTLVQYAAYCIRAMIYAGRGVMDYNVRLGSTIAGIDFAFSPSGASAAALIVAQGTALGTSGYYSIADTVGANPGKRAFDYMETPYVSCARCALVDNAPNALLHSNDFTNAAWTKTGVTASADQTTGSDGQTTMDRLTEDTSTGSHRVLQLVTKGAVTEAWTGRAELKPNSRTQATMIIGASSVDNASITVNLSTGAIISGPTAFGAVTDPRAEIVDLGDGIYEINLTARIPAAVTTGNALIVHIYNSGTSYTGNGTSNLYIGRASYAKASHAMRYGETTTVAAPTGTLQNGVALHARALPVSTSGLLLPFDWIQFNREAQMAAARWDSDAAGRGYLQLARPIRNGPADGDAIIVNNPMMKLLQARNILEWLDRPGGNARSLTDLEVEFLEATAG